MIVLTGFVQIFESKIKAFLFFQTKISFPDSSLSKKVINSDLEKRTNNAFLMMHRKRAITTVQLHLLTKKSSLYTTFQESFSISQTISRSGNCFANFESFIKNSRLCTNQ